ncbi:hypothetical protein HN873_049305 [Arachis hypogaea]
MWRMKKSIRGCISCILPCGALDVIRIVHSNSRVEEITTRTIKAADVMRAHPKHVLRNYSSPNLLIVPPHAELRRGNIYFLVPLPPPPNQYTAEAYQKLSIPTHTSTSRPRRLTLWRPHLDTISEFPPPFSHHLIEELTARTIKAVDVMRAHPNHIIKKYSSSNLVIVSPEADLHRSNI